MSRHSMARLTIGGGLLAAAAVSVVITILAPASAQSLVQQLISFACADPQSCISITNTSHKGKAIVGVAQDNAGIVGRTSINTNKNPNPINPLLLTNGGVWGIDTSTNQLDTNAGVLGTSRNGSGVIGVTTFDSSINQFGQSGVSGFDLGNKPGGTSVGVFGQSNYSTAVFGLGVNAIGIEGAAQNSGLGVIGDTADTPSTPGVGVLALANFGTALLANSSSTGGIATLASTNFGGGDPIQAWSCTCSGNANLVMRIDTAGNETLAGTLTQNGIPMSVSPTSTGSKVLTFAAQQSMRTIEDVGEGQLIHGQAIVNLEHTFASAIDRRRSYLVFITPQGDSNGFLYVAQKSASGFIVREHNGVSNIPFDYRVVAQPYGAPAQRLPAYVAPYAASGGAYRSMVKRVLALKRVHRLRYQP
jgi:hypothetical protein